VPTAQLFQLTDAVKAGNASDVRAALRAGANPDEKDLLSSDQATTPLMIAALNGHLEIMKILLDAGATVNAEDKKGGRPIDYARAAKWNDAIQLLEQRGGESKLASDPLKAYLWLGTLPDYIYKAVESRAKADSAEPVAADRTRAIALSAPADFRGSWQFAAAESDYGNFPKPKSLVFVVTQTTGELQTDISNDGRRIVSLYRLDGTENTNPMGANGKTVTKARWNGAALVLSSTLVWEGVERAAQEEVWSLSPDGAVLTIDRRILKPADARIKQVMKRSP